MTEPETTGTTVSAGEGAGYAGGTPTDATAGGGDQVTEQERAELAALRQQKDQWLREKSNSEEIRRENERLRLEREQIARAYPPPTGQGIDPMQQQLAQDIADLSERDPAALRVIQRQTEATRAELQRQAAEQRYYRELDSIPNEHRADVERICRDNNLWPSMGYDRLRASLYDKERQSLAEQARKLQEETERRQKGVVRTDGAPAPPAPPNTNKITRSDYAIAARQAALGNPQARATIAKYDAGLLQIVDG